MNKIESLREKIKNLKDEIEIVEVELKHEVALEEMRQTFRAALLTEYKAGDLTDVGFERIISAIHLEPITETEKTIETEVTTAA